MQAALKVEEEDEIKRVKEIHVEKEKKEREIADLKQKKFTKTICKDEVIQLGLPRKETPLGSFS